VVKAQMAVVILVVVLAAGWDLRSRRIPNGLVLPALAAGLVLNTISHGAQGLLASLGGAVLALLIFGLVYRLGGMGAGDVKLMAAVGALLALPAAMAALFASVAAGGIIALGAIGWHWMKSARESAGQPLPLRKISIPYGIAISIGTLWTVAKGIFS